MFTGNTIVSVVGSTILFVINHPLEEDTVEKFKFDEKTRTLTHLLEGVM